MKIFIWDKDNTLYMDEEYEVIPTSPIRRLEKRLSKIEATSSSSEIQRLIEQIIELIKSNQRIIDDVIKADAELRNEISRVPGKIDELLGNMGEFIDLLKASATEETVSEVSKDVMKPLTEKITEMVEQNKKILEANQASLANLGMIDKRLKRLYLQFASLYKR
jgi:predicted transcriptional regulator